MAVHITVSDADQAIFRFVAAVCKSDVEIATSAAPVLAAGTEFGLSAVMRAIAPTLSSAAVYRCIELYTLPTRLALAAVPPTAALARITPVEEAEKALAYAVLATRVFEKGTSAAVCRGCPAIAAVAAAVQAEHAEEAAAAGIAPITGLPQARGGAGRGGRGGRGGQRPQLTPEEIAARRAAKKDKKKGKKTGTAAAPTLAPALEAFTKTRIEVAQIVECEPHPESEKLFICKLKVAGEAEPRVFVTGLQPYYSAEDLTGRLVITILNLKTARLAGIDSHAMVLCAGKDDACRCLAAPEGAAVGARVVLDGVAMVEPVKELAGKHWRKVLPEFATGEAGVAQVAGKNLIVEGVGAVAEPNGEAGMSIN